jgi:hypothetical protein
MLKKTFGPARDEIRGGLGKVHKEDLYDLYFSSNIIRVFKSKRLRWAGHVARMRKKNAYKVSMGKSEEKTPNGVGVGVKY